jgi:restriction system protein
MTVSPKVFVARAGRNGEDEDDALELGLAIIGFEEVPSLAAAQDYGQILQLVREGLPAEKPKAQVNYAGQLWAFRLSIREGDIIVLPRKRAPEIALGIVGGPYAHQMVRGRLRHTLPVRWMRAGVPRTEFEQDLLFSFGAFLTVCNVSRNDAARRVAAVLSGGSDPGYAVEVAAPAAPAAPTATAQAIVPQAPVAEEAPTDLEGLLADQIRRRIQSRFAGHALASLVDAVLQAEGWATELSPAGPDGGVDVLAGRGPLGLDAPRLCVQVKSQSGKADVNVYRALRGSMQDFKADQGLLVCWGGFTRQVEVEARQAHFSLRLWGSAELVEAILKNYDRLSAEIQAEMPLKRVWMLVEDEALG